MKLLQRELLVLENNFVKLTTRGRFMGNEVFQYFLEIIKAKSLTVFCRFDKFYMSISTLS